jgi:hypothetical protein
MARAQALRKNTLSSQNVAQNHFIRSIAPGKFVAEALQPRSSRQFTKTPSFEEKRS